MLSKMAKQPNALANYFAQQKQKDSVSKKQPEVYQDNKKLLAKQIDKAPFMVMDHSREIGNF
jgi:hypothetical protein